MSTDSEQPRPSFRFRDKFSRMKDRIKDKIKDKSIKHNITVFVHQNVTSNDTDDNSRHGFRNQMHHYKDVLKNKTHYEDLKHKITDKLDLHDNKTYPKGFYDSLFSPETENDHYLQTAIICLWAIAVLCIIPTIVIIFLPAKKKDNPAKTQDNPAKKQNNPATSTNMIFFHVFICELCYLTYILLAMINVAKEFHMGSTLCDFANYGMYVTIPIMQFALLFLSLERLSKHFKLTMTWLKIFTKPYLIQLILCGIWIFLVALVVTIMFIKKQFNFSFIKDQVNRMAPPILGDVVSKVVGRRHHCSIDGRLSSVFKTLIIILFIILIVKPIVLSIGFNLLTPFCCKNKKQTRQNRGDRRTTNLVTIFLLLNFFFSFPFYFTSMFKSIFTQFDSTKDTFIIILKITFILRLTNIIFECLAFYIFERNSWRLLSKLMYYCTCKKFPILNRKSDDEAIDTKDPGVLAIINQTDHSDNEEEDNEIPATPKEKRSSKKKTESTTESEADDDDGAMGKKAKKRSLVEIPIESDSETPVVKRKKQSSTKIVKSDEDEEKTNKKRRSQTKKIETDEDEPQQVITIKRRSQIKQRESDEDEDEEETKKITITTKRKSKTKKPVSDDEERVTKRKSRPKVEEEEEEEEEEELIEKPKTKSRRNDIEVRVPNGVSASHRRSSEKNTRKSTKNNIKRRSTPSPVESEGDAVSNTSETSLKVDKPVSKQKTKTRPSSTQPKRSRNNSPNDERSRSRSRTKPTSSSHHNHSTKKSRHGTTTKNTHSHKKKSKKDHQTRILEMSDDV